MCGILFSQDSNKIPDLSLLKQRGPEGFNEQENDLGYFAHSMLNTIGENVKQPYHGKHGVLLYNGSVYNGTGGNDTAWLGSRLDDNLENTIEIIKVLNGEFALIYVTNDHIVFCADHFNQRNLWFYFDQPSKQITISSIPDIVHQKHGVSWHTNENKIYVIDKKTFSIDIVTNKIWDLQQGTNHFDYVIEEFEKAVKNRYIPETSTNLLSSGFDSGVINCATHKLFKEIDCVCDPTYEVKETIKERMQIHRSVVLKNEDDHQREQEVMFNEILPSDTVWIDPSVEPLINILKKYVGKRNKKIVLFGTGGDEIYNDWHEQREGSTIGRTNGQFPSTLKLLWPWYNYNNDRLRLVNTRNDFICGYFGIEARNPLLDVNLVQAWLNTTCTIKNQGYKSWMKAYMDQEDYPYTMKKVHWAMEDYQPESWKKLK